MTHTAWAAIRPRPTVAAATVAVALLLAGCGDGSDDATEEVSTVALDLLEGAEAAGTARVGLSLDGDQELGPGLPLEVSMHVEGVVDLESGDQDLAGEGSTQLVLPEGSVDDPAPAVPFSMAVRQVDGRSFTRWGTDAPWTEEPSVDDEVVVVGEDGSVDAEPAAPAEPEASDDGDDALQSLLALEDIDPVAALAQIRDVAKTVTEEGRGDVRGTPTTHFRAVVDDEVVRDLELGSDAEPVVDIWIDDEDRLRRLDIGQVRFELWDFGVPVDIQPPSDVVDWDEIDPAGLGPFVTPTRSGEWTRQASGASAIGPWEVWSAPHEVAGQTITCRTFEAGDLVGMAVDSTGMWPHRNGAPAWCGYGMDFMAFSAAPVRPSLQAFVATSWSEETGVETPLVALVVDDRWAGSPIRIARDGAAEVELAVGPGGVAIWEPDGPAEPTEILLADGEVVCDLVTFEEQMAFDQEEYDDGGDLPSTEDGLEQFPSSLTVTGCVQG